ncbi:MAG: hypothetical protein QOJ03_293 [Frankiaceae bacterium]|nr:hypothetical protein [Frankiaceae bacterium]
MAVDCLAHGCGELAFVGSGDGEAEALRAAGECVGAVAVGAAVAEREVACRRCPSGGTVGEAGRVGKIWAGPVRAGAVRAPVGTVALFAAASVFPPPQAAAASRTIVPDTATCDRRMNPVPV